MKATVRLASPADVDTYLGYTLTTPLNLFDPAIGKYPLLQTLAVDVNDKPSLYVPFHPVIVIESLAHRPDIPARENAYCIYKADQQIEEYARQCGVAETWWMCRDDSLIKAAQRRGYEVVKSAVLRKKITL